jgi:hypothetical protein
MEQGSLRHGWLGQGPSPNIVSSDERRRRIHGKPVKSQLADRLGEFDEVDRLAYVAYIPHPDRAKLWRLSV